MPRIQPANALLLALLGSVMATSAWAKSSDRNQDMTIDAGQQSGSFEGNGKTVLSGGVTVKQGTLEINSAAGEVFMNNGEINRAVFTGKQVKLRQQMDDGTWMDATADRVECQARSGLADRRSELGLEIGV